MFKKIASVVTISAISFVSFVPAFAATGATSTAANDLFSTTTSTTSSGGSGSVTPPTATPTSTPTPTTSGGDLFGNTSATPTTTSSPSGSTLNTDASSYQKSANANSATILEITVDETKPGNFFVKGTLKAPTPISIKKAYIALKFDNTVFDVKPYNVKFAENGFALPTPAASVEVKTDVTDPTVGLLTFSSLSQDPFTNNPQGKIFFVAAFNKKEGKELTSKSFFTVDNKTSFVLDPNDKQLLSDEAIRVPASKTLVTTPVPTATATTPTPVTVTKTPSGIPVVATGSTNSGSVAAVSTVSAKNVKAGVFENTLIAIALMILGGALLIKRRKESIV